MLVTLIPLFDENMVVCAYSIYAQKRNLLLEATMQGAARLDGAVNIAGLELLQHVGIEALSAGKEIFVEINNISIFSDIEVQCQAPHEKVVLLIDNTIPPREDYVARLKELKEAGFKLAMRKLAVKNFEIYREILRLTDYILLDHKKIDVSKARIYFGKIYPNIKLCAINIKTQEEFEELRAEKGYRLYEGEFYRVPLTLGRKVEVSPLKVNYIELLNVVNDNDFDLTEAADVIGRDTALVISMLKMVNRFSVNSEITSIRHAAAMMGQKELKKWINTAVTNELCSDKPNEVTRLSLLRAKFAENLAPCFEMALHSSELFLMGLFSVLDLILDKPMGEALEMVKVSKEIKEALVEHKGRFAPVYDFIIRYEQADWQEISRQLLLMELDMERVYDAYVKSLQWYQTLFE